MESMIHKHMPVGNAHPGMSPKMPGLEVKSQSAAVYEEYGNNPRLKFEVRLEDCGKVEFGRLPYLGIVMQLNLSLAMIVIMHCKGSLPPPPKKKKKK